MVEECIERISDFILIKMDLQSKIRTFYFKLFKRGIKDKDITLISNNCLAGCVLHDFGMRFDTPTINLFIPFPDYIKFLSDLKRFVNKEILDITNGSSYPIGLLGGGNTCALLALQNL